MIKRNLLVIGLAVVLSACGFQLRGTGSTEITLKELDLSARDAYGDTVNLLRRVLQGSGVKIYTGAEYKLILVSEPETQRTASYSGSSRSAEYALTSTLNYELHGFKDRLLPGAIPIVARPGGRRKGEDLVVIKESDIIGNIAS